MSDSSTWEEKGFFELSDQKNLGYAGNGSYGFDVVATGWDGNGITVNHSVVAGTSSEDFYIRLLGLSPRPTNFSGFSDQYPSFLTLANESGQISTLSYGYTAGAKYRGAGTQASLALGGYDVSRFTQNNLTFHFNPVTYRDLVVGISSISARSSTISSPTNLLPETIYSFVDGGTPHIWLPDAACRAFEDYFGLVYDELTELYLVNSTQHNKLVTQNASVTFHLFSPADPDSARDASRKVNITLPYSAFDLEVSTSYPNIENSTRYFPLRRAANETQYTLGRTFLQEAYLTVDYERGNFSIAQTRWDGGEKEIVAIDPPTNRTETPGRSKGSGSGKRVPLAVPIGVGIGAFVALLMGVVVLWWVLRKHRRKKKEASEQEDQSNDIPEKPELDGVMRVEVAEGPDPPEVDELDGEVIVEAPGGLDKPEVGEGLKHELSADQFRAELGDEVVAEMDAEKIAELDGNVVAELDASEVAELDSKEISKLDNRPKK
jgi:hypothetical protein